MYECERFKQFFVLPNFIELAELENLTSLQAVAQGNATEAYYELESWPLERRAKGFFDGWMQVVLILLNLTITCLFILNDQFKEVKKIQSGFWRMLSIPFTAVFLVEAIVVIFSHNGSTIIREKKLYLLEIACQFCSIYGYIKMFT